MQKLRFFFNSLDGRNADSALLREICRALRVVALCFSRTRALFGRLLCWLDRHTDEISHDIPVTMRDGETVGVRYTIRCARCCDAVTVRRFASLADRVRWEGEQ